MIIYKVTNKVNGKIYIGQTIHSLTQRRKKHLYLASKGKDVYFWNALNKYSIDSFKWEVICICPNIQSLNEQEEYYIALWNTCNVGYNLQSGGLNALHNKKTKKKISDSLKGHKISQETKNKISKKLTGSSISKETRLKMSLSNKKFHKQNPNFQKGKNGAFYGKKHSEETKQKMSNAHKGKKKGIPLTEEHKQKLSINRIGIKNSFYGKKHTQKSKQRMSISQKKAWAKRKEEQ